jgi:hypothetical protein
MKRASSSNNEPRINFSASIFAGRPFSDAMLADGDMGPEFSIAVFPVEALCEFRKIFERRYSLHSGDNRRQNPHCRAKDIHNDILA